MENVIKIVLDSNQSGTIATLYKDFIIYQGSYRASDILIYVPKTLEPAIAGNELSVQIGAIMRNEKGEQISTKAFNPNFVRVAEEYGIEYLVYQMATPQAFTMYSGQNEFVINVNLIKVEENAAQFITVVTSQKVAYTVQSSAFLSQEEIIPPADVEIINARLNAIDLTLTEKQDKEDLNLNTTPQTVVGGINQNKQRLDELAPKVDLNTTNIAKNGGRISMLEEQAITAENYVGQIKRELAQGEIRLPDQELNNFVQSVESRPKKNGDVIIFIQVIPNATDKTFKYTFGKNGWDYYEIPSTELAQNGTAGLVKGTFAIDSINETQANIIGGEIKDIYLKDNSNGQLRNAQEFANTNKQNIESNLRQIDNIKNGTTQVGNALKLNGKFEKDLIVYKAQKSIKDDEDNVINTTYAKANDVYTKAESDELFLPSTYTNVYYYSKDGIVDNVPTTPPDEKQFEVVSNQIGNTQIFELEKIVEANYNFNKNSTDKSTFWLKADRDCVLEFRLTTTASKGGVDTLLNVELTGELAFKANTLKQVNINSIYNGLGEEEYKLLKGDTLIKRLDVITTESTETTISLYSGITNASTFNLVAQSISFNVNTINGKKKIEIIASDWKDNGDGTFSVEITPTRHEQAPSNEYGLDLQVRDSANSIQRIAFTPKITDDGVITITSYEAIKCELLVWSAVQEQERGILALENPETLPNIDYLKVGTLRITQTTAPSELTLPIPKNVATATIIHISNASASTETINVNGTAIEKDNVVAFKWDGIEFQVFNTPDNTSEIYDDENNQELNATLRQTKEQLASNMDEINLLTTETSDLNTAVALKLNSKSVELKEGLAVDNLVDFYKYFFNLRKGVDRVWEFEVGKGKNENIMSIFGYPYGEQSSNSAELIVIREATSGIGYTLKIIYTSEKSSTTHIGYIKGWLISGTTYDKYIHFTGWNNASGKKWVDDIKGEVTLQDNVVKFIPMGDLKKPQSNMAIIKIEKNGHSYNGNLLFNQDTPNLADTVIKVESENIYFVANYETKVFEVAKESIGTEKYMIHLFEQR